MNFLEKFGKLQAVCKVKVIIIRIYFVLGRLPDMLFTGESGLVRECSGQMVSGGASSLCKRAYHLSWD